MLTAEDPVEACYYSATGKEGLDVLVEPTPNGFSFSIRMLDIPGYLALVKRKK